MSDLSSGQLCVVQPDSRHIREHILRDHNLWWQTLHSLHINSNKFTSFASIHIYKHFQVKHSCFTGCNITAQHSSIFFWLQAWTKPGFLNQAEIYCRGNTGMPGGNFIPVGNSMVTPWHDARVTTSHKSIYNKQRNVLCIQWYVAMWHVVLIIPCTCLMLADVRDLWHLLSHFLSQISSLSMCLSNLDSQRYYTDTSVYYETHSVVI